MWRVAALRGLVLSALTRRRRRLAARPVAGEPRGGRVVVLGADRVTCGASRGLVLRNVYILRAVVGERRVGRRSERDPVGGRLVGAARVPFVKRTFYHGMSSRAAIVIGALASQQAQLL